MIELGYRIGNSPFPINADLEFSVPIPASPSLGSDPVPGYDESGNPIAATELIQFGCYMRSSARQSTRDREMGLSITRAYMPGRVIEQVTATGERVSISYLDSRVYSGLTGKIAIYPPTVGDLSALAVLRGYFEIDIPNQSGWQAVRLSLGDAIGGFFQQEGIYGNTHQH